MYKNLEKKRQYEKEYAKRCREKARATQDEIRRKIAAAIVATELLQESNG